MFDDISELIGIEGAIRLAMRYPDQPIYVPKRRPNALWKEISELIGKHEAELLRCSFAGDQITLPIKPAKRAFVRQMHKRGATVIEIARAMKCTRRTIYNYLKL